MEHYVKMLIKILEYLNFIRLQNDEEQCLEATSEVVVILGSYLE